MNQIGKMYKLKNGYKICKTSWYDGCNMRYYWSVWSPNGEIYMNCGSYAEAMELASNLTE